MTGSDKRETPFCKFRYTLIQKASVVMHCNFMLFSRLHCTRWNILMYSPFIFHPSLLAASCLWLLLKQVCVCFSKSSKAVILTSETEKISAVNYFCHLKCIINIIWSSYRSEWLLTMIERSLCYENTKISKRTFSVCVVNILNKTTDKITTIWCVHQFSISQASTV